MRFLIILCFALIANTVQSQTAPDFTITDSDGVVHQLYADHLDQGKTVVLKLFFTTCPPCISIAPWTEERYQYWGAGEYDVEFIELSVQAFDDNEDVAAYKDEYNLTFPGAGYDGGSKDAALIYQSGTFGPYFGTPTFVIIAPDGTVNMDFAYEEMDEAIAATGATGNSGGGSGGGGMDIPAVVNISSTSTSSTLPASVKYYLKPQGADSPKYDILDITGGSLTFDYPSADFPELENPVISIEAEGSITDASVNVLDLLRMRKHILELELFTTDAQLKAADVTGDDKVNALDLINLQKAILELITNFPNDTPAWKTIPSEVPFDASPGANIDINFTLVKTGNVN